MKGLILAALIYQTGIASWYGPGFQGHTTASGEFFREDSLTAASRTLPFGTRVLVTNLENGRTVVIRINDRGPYVNDRMIDLSEKAAEELGMIISGTARVSLQVLQEGD